MKVAALPDTCEIADAIRVKKRSIARTTLLGEIGAGAPRHVPRVSP
jgi:hypothetical protein